MKYIEKCPPWSARSANVRKKHAIVANKYEHKGGQKLICNSFSSRIFFKAPHNVHILCTFNIMKSHKSDFEVTRDIKIRGKNRI